VRLLAVTVGRRIPLIAIFFFIGVYLWLFGDNYFPEYWSTMGTTVSFYVAMFFASIFIADARLQNELRTPISRAALPYLVSFAVTFIVTSALFRTGQGELVIPMAVLQIAIVAPTEELMFRGVLLSYLGWSVAGIVIQAVFFSAWHWVVYTGLVGLDWSAIVSLTVAFAFGVMMGFLARDKRWGLPATMACHAAFNIAILGVLI
jgi:membrane protease YdiL (CAAX protease family)